MHSRRPPIYSNLKLVACPSRVPCLRSRATWKLVEAHGAQAPLFHDVTPLTIRIDADGKVVGASSGNGCRMLGLARPLGNNVMSIDVTLTGCAHASLNRRITGTAGYYVQDKRLDLNLHKVDIGTRPVTSFKVGGSLRRCER